MSEIRLKRLTGEWVIIAPERAKRGGNLARATELAGAPPFVENRPFCPGNETVAGEERYRDGGHRQPWRVRSIVNKFSVLSATEAFASAGPPAQVAENINGVGLHEVLVESPRHDLSMAVFEVEQIEGILEAYCHRFRAFYADPG